LLNVRPSNKVLEIGGGAGIFAGQIAGRLTTGKLTAVDKSKPMIK
jgi:ubiquinone/menaquinone biosynthesis C-methylase UbiE